MMLVQKPSTFPMSPINHPLHHRRHPSAPPAVVVQPTKIPGLLSLSKPQPVRHQPQQRSPRLTQPAAVGYARPAGPKHNNANTQQPPATPTPARGRQVKDKQQSPTRSESVSTRRHPRRQESPSQLPTASSTSQAEGTTSIHSGDQPSTDPFFVSSTTTSQTSPKLAVRPSGKLARRRQQHNQHQHSPSSTNANIHQSPASKQANDVHPVPIPTSQTKANVTKQLSRSVPLPLHKPPTKRNHKSIPSSVTDDSRIQAWDFPICDDMTDAGDYSDNDHFANNTDGHSLPATPTRATTIRQPATEPRALPIRKQRASKVNTGAGHGRNHKRSPSEGGVFHMSSDEASSEDATSVDTAKVFALTRSNGVAALAPPGHGAGKRRSPAKPAKRQSVPSFPTVPSPRGHGTLVGEAVTDAFGPLRTPLSVNPSSLKERQLEAQAHAQLQAQGSGYFASSTFQNSPSPDELPDPMFV